MATGNYKRKPIWTQEQVDGLPTTAMIIIAADLLPAAFAARFRRLAEALQTDAPGFNPSPSAIGKRDALIREHDRLFNPPAASLTARAKSIAKDLEKASQIAVPTSNRLVSAKAILSVTGGKTVKYRRVMDVIRPI